MYYYQIYFFSFYSSFILIFAKLFYRIFFFFNDTAPTEIYTLSLHDALPIYRREWSRTKLAVCIFSEKPEARGGRSEEHTSELQSRLHLVCRLLLEKKKKKENCRLVLQKDEKQETLH